MATIFVRRRPDSVMEWRSEDVSDWLCQLDLEKYCKRFQNLSVTGPVLLELDELLLDDLHITSAQDRRDLLAESSRLCSKELALVTGVSRDTVPSIHVTCEDDDADSLTLLSCDRLESSESESLTLQIDYNEDTNDDDDDDYDDTEECDSSPAVTRQCSGADEVASRATLMVTMLSEENSNLRSQLDHMKLEMVDVEQLKDEIEKLQSSKKRLETTVTELRSRNITLTKANEELRLVNLELQDVYRERGKLENEIKEALEEEIKALTSDNKSLTEKLAKNRRNIMNHKDGCQETRDSSSPSPRNTPPSNPVIPNHAKTTSISTESNNNIINGELNNLKLINEIYRANKRCAELENTIRLMHSELYMSDGHMGQQLISREGVGEEEDDPGPCAPDWPSFIISSFNKDKNENTHSTNNQEYLHILRDRGLPTDDDDDDIWTKQTNGTTNKINTIEDPGSPNSSLLHFWNV